MPKQTLVKLPSAQPPSAEAPPVFMVHPIEGVVDLLRGVASEVAGAVFGLQCAAGAPLSSMAALAEHYVTHVRTVRPHQPYLLLGYSFGAAVAFEMALHLEEAGAAVRLVLVDGSPAYVATHTTRGRTRGQSRGGSRGQRTRPAAADEADALAYFAQLFRDIDAAKVSAELERLPSWESRVERVTSLIDSGSHSAEALAAAAASFYKKLVIADAYKPTRQLRAPVTLFTARDNYVTLGEDYGLRAVCTGEVKCHQLAGTHRTILTGDAARDIASHLSALVRQQL